MKTTQLKKTGIFCCLICLVFFLPCITIGEFYEYINEDGVRSFTNDPSVINEIKNKNLKVHKERFDDLDEDERQRLLQEEREKAGQIRKAKQKKLKAWDDAEKEAEKKKAELAKKKRLAKLKTPITRRGNHILVPVTIAYSGKKVTSQLVLDTGASITAIHDTVASQLNMDGYGRKSLVRVAGGGIITSKVVNIDYIKVGPKVWKKPRIMVLPTSGPKQFHNGLLGQDFLQRYNYTIDAGEGVIKWDD